MTAEQSFFNKSKLKNGERSKWVIFLVSVAVAFLLWFFQSLEENYKTTIKVNINYSHISNAKVLRYPLPDQLYLTINAKGIEIIRFKRWAKNNSLSINLNSTKKTLLLTDSYIKSQLPEKLDKTSIIIITPTFINIEYDNLSKKKVAVIPKVKYSCRHQYCITDEPNISPQFIELYGPENEINKIDFINTKAIEFKDLYSSVYQDIELIKPDNKNIKLSTTKVRYNLKVEQLTEGNFNIDIHLPREMKNKIILIPDKVNITYQAALSKFSEIKESDFYPTVTYEDLKKSMKLKVIVKYDNKIVKNIRYYPEYIGFILKDDK